MRKCYVFRKLKNADRGRGIVAAKIKAILK
jgi:hypothetical protein